MLEFVDFNFDAEHSRITTSGIEIAYQSDKFSTRIIKGIEDVMGYEAASQLIKANACKATLNTFMKIQGKLGIGNLKTPQEKMEALFLIWKKLGNGSVTMVELSPTRAVFETHTSFLAVGYQENMKNWHWPQREKPFCHDLTGYLQAVVAAALQIPPQKITATETECMTMGAEKCTFILEVSA